MLKPTALGDVDWADFQKTGFQTCGISDSLQSSFVKIFTFADDFFKSDIETKLGDRLSSDIGYRPFGVEYSYSPDRPDRIESFSFMPTTDDAEHQLRSQAAKSLYIEMKTAFRLLQASAEHLVAEIFKRVTGSSAGDRFAGGFRAWSHLQINREASDQGDRDTDLDAHEDGCLFTIMTNTGPGLEIKHPDGTFRPVEAKSDEVLVISGEILWLLSGGLISPTHHRVKPQQKGRMALLFFADLESDFCVPWIQSSTNKYINIGERSRFNATRYGLRPRQIG
jgi:isopenicillin N synthase-like dioxygenase